MKKGNFLLKKEKILIRKEREQGLFFYVRECLPAHLGQSPETT